MMNSSESLAHNRYDETPDQGGTFGESRLSNINFEPQEFPGQAPDESDRDYADREMRADERIFLVGLVKAETQGPNGMAEALRAPDFRLRRSQRREFLDAVGKMSEEEYGARINNVLGVFTNEEAKTAAMDIADYYWLTAKRRASERAAIDEADAEENTITRTHHEKPRKYRWRVEEKPEMPKSQAEVMLANPQRYYREQKQERRGKKLFEKIKGVFDKFKKEEKIPRRARSGVEPEDFDVRPAVSTPQVEVAMSGNATRRHEENTAEGTLNLSPAQESMTSEYPAPVPAGTLYGRERPENGYFNDTEFYQDSQPGQYFGQEEDIMPVTEESPEETEIYIGRHSRKSEKEPLHTNDFSFGEEGSF